MIDPRLILPPLLLLAAGLLPNLLCATRLAILLPDKQADLEALLTVELASQGFELVERQELDRILREQQMSAAGFTVQDTIKLGELLGAHGLILGQESDERKVLSIRLLATGPGVVLEQLFVAIPAASIDDTVVEVSQAAKRFMEKMALPRDAAIALSLTRLRDDRPGPESHLVETRLNTMLAESIVREPAFFLLERHQMRLLSRERELNMEENSFWTGRSILEGTFSRPLNDGDPLVVRLAVRGPDGSAHTVSAQGPPDALADIAQDVTGQLLELFNKQPMARDWDTKSEAAAFFTKAEKAYQLWQYEDAQTYGEAALALGHDSPRLYHFWIASRSYALRDRIYLSKRDGSGNSLNMLELALLSQGIGKDSFNYSLTDPQRAGLQRYLDAVLRDSIQLLQDFRLFLPEISKSPEKRYGHFYPSTLISVLHCADSAIDGAERFAALNVESPYRTQLMDELRRTLEFYPHLKEVGWASGWSLTGIYDRFEQFFDSGQDFVAFAERCFGWLREERQMPAKVGRLEFGLTDDWNRTVDPAFRQEVCRLALEKAVDSKEDPVAAVFWLRLANRAERDDTRRLELFQRAWAIFREHGGIEREEPAWVQGKVPLEWLTDFFPLTKRDERWRTFLRSQKDFLVKLARFELTNGRSPSQTFSLLVNQSLPEGHRIDLLSEEDVRDIYPLATNALKRLETSDRQQNYNEVRRMKFALSSLRNQFPWLKETQERETLKVTEFIHPYRELDPFGFPEAMWGFHGLTENDGWLWFFTFGRFPKQGEALLCRVNLETRKWEYVRPPTALRFGEFWGADIFFYDNQVILVYRSQHKDEEGGGSGVARFYLKDNRWETHADLWPNGEVLFHEGKLFVPVSLIMGKSGGAVELDLVTGKKRMLINSRRNPPESPFDGHGFFRFVPVCLQDDGSIVFTSPKVGLHAYDPKTGAWRKVNDRIAPWARNRLKLRLHQVKPDDFAFQHVQEHWILHPKEHVFARQESGDNFTETVTYLCFQTPERTEPLDIPLSFELSDETLDFLQQHHRKYGTEDGRVERQIIERDFIYNIDYQYRSVYKGSDALYFRPRWATGVYRLPFEDIRRWLRLAP